MLKKFCRQIRERSALCQSLLELSRHGKALEATIFAVSCDKLCCRQPWADSDDIEATEIRSLGRVCRLIELLALLAIGVDKDSSPDGYNLFFALPPDGAKPREHFCSLLRSTSKCSIMNLTT